jgi:uncharacterized RDD family membrane protein YckC
MNNPAWNATTRSLVRDDDDLLTEGVLTRRCVAWCLDMMLISVLMSVLWFVLFTFGIVTLGLGLPLLGVLPAVPFLYHFGFLASSGATPGQSVCGLVVRNNNDLEPASGGQALVFTLAYYLTLAVSGGLLFLCAFFTIRRRTLHDLLSGTVVIRSRALTPPSRSWNMPGGPPFRA